MAVTSVAMRMKRDAASTGWRSTTLLRPGEENPRGSLSQEVAEEQSRFFAHSSPLTVFKDQGVGKSHPGREGYHFDDNVKGDGNCLYWAFGVLLGSYGTPVSGYQQWHLTSSGIRGYLKTYIEVEEHWSRHFLRILRRTQAITQETAGLDEVEAAIRDVETFLKTEMVTTRNKTTGKTNMVSIHERMQEMDMRYFGGTQGHDEASTDPQESLEMALRDLIKQGNRVGTVLKRKMQLIVDTYIARSLNSDRNYAESLAAELLSEAFGVIIFYYQGDQSEDYVQTEGFKNARLVHVFYPDPETRAAVEGGGDEQSRKRALERPDVQRAFHLIRLDAVGPDGRRGNGHFYYGKRPSDPTRMMKPWEKHSEAKQAEAALADAAAAAKKGAKKAAAAPAAVRKPPNTVPPAPTVVAFNPPVMPRHRAPQPLPLAARPTPQRAPPVSAKMENQGPTGIGHGYERHEYREALNDELDHIFAQLAYSKTSSERRELNDLAQALIASSLLEDRTELQHQDEDDDDEMAMRVPGADMVRPADPRDEVVRSISDAEARSEAFLHYTLVAGLSEQAAEALVEEIFSETAATEGEESGGGGGSSQDPTPDLLAARAEHRARREASTWSNESVLRALDGDLAWTAAREAF